MDFLSEIICESVILGIDSLLLGFCAKQLGKCKYILCSLEQAPVLDSEQILAKEFPECAKKMIPYAVVRGMVKPLGEPIKSSYQESVTGVVQRITIKEHVIARSSGGFWSDQTRTIHEVFNAIPFLLKAGASEVEVSDAHSADLLDMEVTADKFEPMSPGVIDHVWGFFSGVRQRGLQTMEEMLRVGTYITAIGELSSNNGIIKISLPANGLPLYFTTSSKSALVNRLKSSKDFLKVLVGFFGVVALLASGRILFLYLKRRKRTQEESDMRKRLAENRKERRAQVRDSKYSEVQLCVVCAENPKEVILLPCGHVCVCEDCSDNIPCRCPVCRKNIMSRSPAFIV